MAFRVQSSECSLKQILSLQIQFFKVVEFLDLVPVRFHADIETVRWFQLARDGMAQRGSKVPKRLPDVVLRDVVLEGACARLLFSLLVHRFFQFRFYPFCSGEC